ncbi:MAG TPA: DUF1697 domain-containing protein [Gemmatimonadales bacterium]
MTYFALVRAINVAGHNMVGMADLRTLLGELGFTTPRTLLQAGNLIFESAERSEARIERLLAEGAKRRLGLDTDFFVRGARELRSVVRENPFPRDAERDPKRLMVMFLREAPDKQRVQELNEAITGREVAQTKGRQAYIVYPDGVGRSRLTITLIERKLGTRGTGRNWNTVRKLAALADG